MKTHLFNDEFYVCQHNVHNACTYFYRDFRTVFRLADFHLFICSLVCYPLLRLMFNTLNAFFLSSFFELNTLSAVKLERLFSLSFCMVHFFCNWTKTHVVLSTKYSNEQEKKIWTAPNSTRRKRIYITNPYTNKCTTAWIPEQLMQNMS